ncbi:MAG: alanine racemase [Cellvibrionaceae bacterium]|nr:alanine racemase [Cellvibrionaceae bacterium]
MSSAGELCVDLDALVSNWHRVKAELRSGVDCAAVVKANAYGLGSLPVVRALLNAGCKSFFVATVDEAIELRESVPGDYRLVVLGGMAYDQFDACEAYKLTPVLTNFSHVERWSSDCLKANHGLPSILKIDTGMHRLGLDGDDLKRLIDRVDLLKTSLPVMVMSHLACADMPDAALNTHQLSLFTSAYGELVNRLPHVQASLANSSGVFLGKTYHFDCVRPGAALYGVNPTPDKINPMRPVLTLNLAITQMKSIAAGETVGYGGEFTAEKPSLIAITFGGYADGVLRVLGNAGQGYYKNHPVPIIGRVSMDALVFDLSSVPDNLLAGPPGHIQLLGDCQSVDQLAAEAGTIAYEMLTSIGRRYQRIYSASDTP